MIKDLVFVLIGAVSMILIYEIRTLVKMKYSTYSITTLLTETQSQIIQDMIEEFVEENKKSNNEN